VPKMPKTPKVVVTIAGSDPSCGAGLQADVRTLEQFGVDCASVVTAVTVQDGLRVAFIRPLAPALVGAQLASVLASREVAVVKCGMLARVGTVDVVAQAVAAAGVPLVVDPVLRAAGGEALGDRRLRAALAERLFPLATVVTCNLSEATAFAGEPIENPAAMERAARVIAATGARAVVVKGGHLAGEPLDVLWDGRRIRVYRSGGRIARSMHGTGCAFASAVAAGLARGVSLPRSVEEAGRHVRTLLREARRSPAGAWLRQPPKR